MARAFPYIVIPAMYRTSTSCPSAVRSARLKLIVRMGIIFFYMGEMQECYVIYWLDAPVAK